MRFLSPLKLPSNLDLIQSAFLELQELQKGTYSLIRIRQMSKTQNLQWPFQERILLHGASSQRSVQTLLLVLKGAVEIASIQQLSMPLQQIFHVSGSSSGNSPRGPSRWHARTFPNST